MQVNRFIISFERSLEMAIKIFFRETEDFFLLILCFFKKKLKITSMLHFDISTLCNAVLFVDILRNLKPTYQVRVSIFVVWASKNQ